MSDDLNLNEIECVRLLVSANKEVSYPCLDIIWKTMFVLEISILTLFTNDSCQWVLFGREPLEMFRLAACLWYMERRDLITSLYTVFRVMHMSFWYRYDVLHNIWLKLSCYSTMLFFILSVLCKNMSVQLTFSLAGCCT